MAESGWGLAGVRSGHRGRVALLLLVLAASVLAPKGFGVPSASAETIAPPWSGSIFYDYFSSSGDATGGSSDAKTAVWNLDGTMSASAPNELQPAHLDAASDENFWHNATTGCPSGMTMRRYGAVSEFVDPAGAVSVTGPVEPGQWQFSASMTEDAFPATESGTGCWQASPPPVLTQVTTNVPTQYFTSAAAPDSVQGSFLNPAAEASGHECFAWRITRAADADYDGIPDSVDPSPTVAADPPACVADADGDGVPDANDQCPNTPPGSVVDSTGCVAPVVPQAPTGVSAVAGDGQVVVSWTPPTDNGGSPLTGYAVTVTNATGGAPAGVAGTTTRSSASSPFTFNGLTNGIDYRFRVAAVNAVGTGASSTLSPTVRPRPRISIGDSAVVEGSAGSRGLRISVGLSAPSTRAVSFHYATSNGTASSPSDYTAASGTGTISAGLQGIALTVPIVGNQTSEPNETVKMTISAPANAVIRDGVGVATILNDDPPASGLRVSIGNASIEEGRTGNRSVVLTVTLSAPSASSVTVHFASANVTATSGVDYFGGSGTITIPAGTLTSLLSFSVKGDTIVESNETYHVTLSSPVGALLGRSQGTATIINDD